MSQRRPTAVVTGASSGIGAEVASILGLRGWDLVLVNRSRDRSQDVLARLKAESPSGRVEVVEADLSDQEQVRAAAAEIARAHPAFDALFNVAGLLLGELKLSKHGNEMQFQVNTLAPYMLTRLLHGPLAAAGAENGPGAALRPTVLNVSSGAVNFAGRLKVDELRKPAKFSRLTGAYAQSKLALTTLTNALAPEYGPDVVLRSADPGGNRTKMTAGEGMPRLLAWVLPFMKPPGKGAQVMVDAAFDPRFGDRTGLFVGSSGREKTPPRDANDPEVQKRLVALCRELTGV